MDAVALEWAIHLMTAFQNLRAIVFTSQPNYLLQFPHEDVFLGSISLEF